MIVKRVRLRSMICVDPNEDDPTPKAPERPASLPEWARIRMITPNASSMCTAIAAMRMISLTLVILPAPASQNRRSAVPGAGERDAPHDVGADRGPRHRDHVRVALDRVDAEERVGDARAEHERRRCAPAALELEHGREQRR